MAVIFRRRRRNPDGTMTLLEHLGELRTRLVVSLLAVAVCSIAGWFLYRPVFDLLTNPFCDFVRRHPELSPGSKTRCGLAYFSVLEPFLVKLKVTVFIGLALALPVVLYEVWRFITPGLTSKERRFAVPFVLASMVLFALGALFAVYTLPKALNFLLGFAGTTRLFAVLSIDKYIGFITLVILAFGVSFEFPLVLLSLVLVGVLDSRKLRSWRKQAILFIAIFAAVITPSQDWFTMTAMMLPLILFYELTILVSRLLKK
jgi:sec-independent protein translocase protein TatC